MSRRERQRRAARLKRVVIIGLIAFMMMIGTCAVTARTANAGDASDKRFKYYTTITVQSGDTLWAIAEEYRTEEYGTISAYIKEVQTLNHLNGSEIISGSSLVVPYYSNQYKI